MDSAQRELICVLLDRIRTLGLISNSTCSGAMDLVNSSINLPDFFQNPVCLTAEESEYKRAENT